MRADGKNTFISGTRRDLSGQSQEQASMLIQENSERVVPLRDISGSQERQRIQEDMMDYVTC